MDEIRSNYYETIKEQKSCLPKHIVKSETTDNTTHCYSSVVYGKPIRWESWKVLPADMKTRYIEYIFEQFGRVSTNGIAIMMGVSDATIVQEFKKLGIKSGRAKPSNTKQFLTAMNITNIPPAKKKSKAKSKKQKNDDAISMDALEKKCKSTSTAPAFHNLTISCTMNASDLSSLAEKLCLTGKIKVTIESV